MHDDMTAELKGWIERQGERAGAWTPLGDAVLRFYASCGGKTGKTCLLDVHRCVTVVPATASSSRLPRASLQRGPSSRSTSSCFHKHQTSCY